MNKLIRTSTKKFIFLLNTLMKKIKLTKQKIIYFMNSFAKGKIDIIKKILNEVSVPIQLGGGIRNMDYARQLLDLDIERLIIGTMGIQQPETITQLSDEYGPERIMISLDSKDNKVVIKGWQEKIDKSPSEIANDFKEHGAGSILFTNVDVEGLLGGFYTEPVEDLKKSVDLPIVYSGGITTIDDIKKLNESGVEGIVIGSALYTDKIDLTEALKYQKRI